LSRPDQLRVFAIVIGDGRDRLGGSDLRGSAAAAVAGAADLGLADLVGDATHHRKILSPPPRSTRTTLPGVSGVLTNTYTAEVDHDFRRWLTAVGRFTYGTQASRATPASTHLSLSGD